MTERSNRWGSVLDAMLLSGAIVAVVAAVGLVVGLFALVNMLPEQSTVKAPASRAEVEPAVPPDAHAGPLPRAPKPQHQAAGALPAPRRPAQAPPQSAPPPQPRAAAKDLPVPQAATKPPPPQPPTAGQAPHAAGPGGASANAPPAPAASKNSDAGLNRNLGTALTHLAEDPEVRRKLGLLKR